MSIHSWARIALEADLQGAEAQGFDRLLALQGSGDLPLNLWLVPITLAAAALAYVLGTGLITVAVSLATRTSIVAVFREWELADIIWASKAGSVDPSRLAVFGGAEEPGLAARRVRRIELHTTLHLAAHAGLNGRPEEQVEAG